MKKTIVNFHRLIDILVKLFQLLSFFGAVFNYFNLKWVFISIMIILFFILNVKREFFEKFPFISKYRLLTFLIIIFLVLTELFSKYYLSKNENCEQSNKNYGILISDFNADVNGEFTSKIFNVLSNKLMDFDTFSIVKTYASVEISNNKEYTTLDSMFYLKCYNKGILAYGNWNFDTKLFDCNLYLKNFIPRFDTISVAKNNIIYIENPDFINFSINKQADLVTDFILSLIFYQQQLYTQSNEILNKIINNYGSQDEGIKNTALKIKGHNLIKMRDYSSAKIAFESLTNKNYYTDYVISKIDEFVIKDNIEYSGSQNSYLNKNGKVRDTSQINVINKSSDNVSFEDKELVKKVEDSIKPKSQYPIISKRIEIDGRYIYDICIDSTGYYGLKIGDGTWVLKPVFDSIVYYQIKSHQLKNSYILCKKNSFWGAFNLRLDRTYNFTYKDKNQIVSKIYNDFYNLFNDSEY